MCFGGYVSKKDSLHASSYCNNIEIGKIYDDKDLFFTNIWPCSWDRCAKRECYLKALNLISGDILEKHICYAEDFLLSHALSLCMKKYVHIGRNGYFYNLNDQSLCTQRDVMFNACEKAAKDTSAVYDEIILLSKQLQDWLIYRLSLWIKNREIIGPYTDKQLQQIYDIYMRINFDDEHKAKLSEYLKDGMEEMRKLRDGSSKE